MICTLNGKLGSLDLDKNGKLRWMSPDGIIVKKIYSQCKVETISTNCIKISGFENMRINYKYVELYFILTSFGGKCENCGIENKEKE